MVRAVRRGASARVLPRSRVLYFYGGTQGTRRSLDGLELTDQPVRDRASGLSYASRERQRGHGQCEYKVTKTYFISRFTRFGRVAVGVGLAAPPPARRRRRRRRRGGIRVACVMS